MRRRAGSCGRWRGRRTSRAGVVSHVVDGLPQVVPSIGRQRAVRLLRLEAGPREIPVGEAGRDLVPDDRLDRRSADVELSLAVVGGPRDRARGDLRLVDRRNRLGLVRKAALHPVELGRVECRHLQHHDAHVAAVVEQLGAQRVHEPLDRVLGRAVRGLERDTPVGERRADLDDGAAIARQHALERGKRAVDVPEVRHLGHAAEILGRHLLHGREDREHRVVDPDVDGPELGLHLRGCGLDGIGVGDVERQHEGAAALGFDVALRSLEPHAPACDQPDARPAPREFLDGRTTHACGCARHDHDFFVSVHGRPLDSAKCATDGPARRRRAPGQMTSILTLRIVMERFGQRDPLRESARTCADARRGHGPRPHRPHHDWLRRRAAAHRASRRDARSAPLVVLAACARRSSAPAATMRAQQREALLMAAVHGTTERAAGDGKSQGSAGDPERAGPYQLRTRCPVSAAWPSQTAPPSPPAAGHPPSPSVNAGRRPARRPRPASSSRRMPACSRPRSGSAR